MKKSTIKFNLSADFCISKAESYYDDGDYVLALSYLQRLEEGKLSQEQFEDYCYIRAQICHIFGTDAGNFWAFKYCAKHGYSEKLAPMIAYATIDNDMLLSNFQKGELPDFLQEFISAVEETGDVDMDSLRKYQTKKRELVFLSDKIADQAIAEGDKLMKAGKFEEAIVLFKKVPTSSAKYSDSLSDIALCHLFLANYKKSYEINKMVLENYPKNLQSILQLLSLCNILEKNDEFKKYLEVVQSMKHTPNDSIKVANILIDAREFKLAIPHFEFAFDSLNYSLEGYVTYIVTLYNAEKQKRAIIEMKEIIKFFPDNAVLWYLLSQMDGREVISYEPLFADVVDVCEKIGLRIAKSGSFSEDTFKDSKKLAYLKYACGKSGKSIEFFDKILTFKSGVAMFCELLYHPQTSPVQRANILRYLMKNNFKGKVLFRGATYKYLKVSYPACTNDNNLLFVAYAFAFSTMAYFESDFETQLKRAMASFVRACKKKDIPMEEYFTPDMVSALVVAKMKKLTFDIICDFAGVDKKKFLYIGLLVFGEEFKTYEKNENSFNLDI
ncbi:MAG: hypothetical protein R3Y32_04200 [Bacillota bacterium]